MNLLIVYAERDTRFLALDIYDACMQSGLDVFVDMYIPDVEKLEDTVRKWVAMSDVVLVLWSERAKESSLCCAKLRIAIELRKRVIVIPLLRADDLDLPAPIDAMEILEISDWKAIPEAVAKHLSASPTQSCFISYSMKDDTFVKQLHRDLTDNGVRCWFAPHDMRSGRKIHEQIEEAINQRDRLLLVVSEHSMRSNWVVSEVIIAREKEREHQRQILFPVRLVDWESIKNWNCFDADSGKDIAREIREYFILDFSDWRSIPAYEASLVKLVHDLKGS